MLSFINWLISYAFDIAMVYFLYRIMVNTTTGSRDISHIKDQMDDNAKMEVLQDFMAEAMEKHQRRNTTPVPKTKASSDPA